MWNVSGCGLKENAVHETDKYDKKRCSDEKDRSKGKIIEIY